MKTRIDTRVKSHSIRSAGLLIVAATVSASALIPTAAADDSVFEAKMQQLLKMSGRWVVEEHYEQPKGTVGKGKARFTEALDDTHILLEYETKTKDWGTLEGHGVFTYDRDDGKYRYWWFANMGQPKSFDGIFNNKRQALVFTETANQFPIQRHSFSFTTDDELVFKMESSEDGKKWTLDLTTNYSRKGKRETEAKKPARPANRL